MVDRQEMDMIEQNSEAIEKFVHRIRNSNIGMDNYKDYFVEVKSNLNIISTMCETLSNIYKDHEQRYIDDEEKDYIKSAKESDMIPIDHFRDFSAMSKYKTTIMEFQILKGALLQEVYFKVSKLLDLTSFYELKKDAMQESKEHIKAVMDFSKEQADGRIKAIETNYKLMEDKYLNVIRENDIRYNELFNAVTNRFLLLVETLTARNDMNKEEKEELLNQIKITIQEQLDSRLNTPNNQRYEQQNRPEKNIRHNFNEEKESNTNMNYQQRVNQEMYEKKVQSEEVKNLVNNKVIQSQSRSDENLLNLTRDREIEKAKNKSEQVKPTLNTKPIDGNEIFKLMKEKSEKQNIKIKDIPIQNEKILNEMKSVKNRNNTEEDEEVSFDLDELN